MKQNKKYLGNAVQAILDTVIEKYRVGGEENIQAIVRLLNTSLDMAFMYDLKEINEPSKTCAQINDWLRHDGSNYRIHRRGYKYFIMSTI